MDALRRALANGQLPADLQKQVVAGNLTISDAVRLAAGRSYSTPSEIAPMVLGADMTEFAVAVAEYMSAVRALHVAGHCAAVCEAESPDPDGRGWHPTHAAEVARYEAASTILELWLSVEAMK